MDALFCQLLQILVSLLSIHPLNSLRLLPKFLSLFDLVVKLTLYLGYSPSFYFFVEDDCSLLSSLFQSVFCILFGNSLKSILLFLHDCPLGLDLHLFKLAFYLSMKIIEWSRWKKSYISRIIFLIFYKIQRFLLSIKLNNSNPFISLLLSSSISGLSFQLQLFFKRQFVYFL